MDRAPSPYDEYLTDNCDLKASLLSSHQSLLVTGFPYIASADPAVVPWATSHLVALDFMLNATDCKSLDTAAAKLLEVLQTDWPELQVTLKQKKVAVRDIFFGTAKQKRSACTVSFTVSGPLEAQTTFMFYHCREGSQLATLDIVHRDPTANGVPGKNQDAKGMPSIRFAHTQLLEHTSIEYRATATVQSIDQSVYKHEVAAQDMLKLVLKAMYLPKDNSSISSNAASALARLAESDGMERTKERNSKAFYLNLRDNASSKVFSEMSAIAFGTDKHFFILSFKADSARQGALKYGIRITDFPAGHHYIQPQIMWRITKAIAEAAGTMADACAKQEDQRTRTCKKPFEVTEQFHLLVFKADYQTERDLKEADVMTYWSTDKGTNVSSVAPESLEEMTRGRSGLGLILNTASSSSYIFGTLGAQGLKEIRQITVVGTHDRFTALPTGNIIPRMVMAPYSLPTQIAATMYTSAFGDKVPPVQLLKRAAEGLSQRQRMYYKSDVQALTNKPTIPAVSTAEQTLEQEFEELDTSALMADTPPETL